MKKITRLTLPNLFIVGAPKCGTTSLCNYLRQHPQVFITEPKEPNFFNTDLLRKNRMSEQEYFQLFEKSASFPVRGEGTPLYLMSKEAPANLARFNPDAKVVISTRQPWALIVSAFYQNRSNTVETSASLVEALNLESERASWDYLPHDPEPVGRLLYRRMASLAEQIQEYQRHFPPEQIHIIQFDRFFDDVPAGLKELLEFLEVDDLSQEILPEVHNPASDNRFAGLAGLYRHPPAWLSASARRLMSDKTRSKIYTTLRGWNEKPVDKSEQDEAQEMLREFNNKQVSQLEELLSWNLTHWKLP
ncbi:sulfotransferase [bacterium SCSIO 12741]|nr:sulfotransferase [bacterium SCSIO 12741]